ncbi:hypothetical protein J6590_080288 [Homalodisca vitripennis]|nr:hypothetical protein J6590_080288 [Homalodisca vitripennis]
MLPLQQELNSYYSWFIKRKAPSFVQRKYNRCAHQSRVRTGVSEWSIGYSSVLRHQECVWQSAMLTLQDRFNISYCLTSPISQSGISALSLFTDKSKLILHV